jgi:hypothetical protein
MASVGFSVGAATGGMAAGFATEGAALLLAVERCSEGCVGRATEDGVFEGVAGGVAGPLDNEAGLLSEPAFDFGAMVDFSPLGGCDHGPSTFDRDATWTWATSFSFLPPLRSKTVPKARQIRSAPAPIAAMTCQGRSVGGARAGGGGGGDEEEGRLDCVGEGGDGGCAGGGGEGLVAAIWARSVVSYSALPCGSSKQALAAANSLRIFCEIAEVGPN